MTQKQIFAIYYSGLVAMQMHPKNEALNGTPEAIEEILQRSSLIARRMMQITEELWHG